MRKSLPLSSSQHPVARPIEQLLQACDIRRTRRSGPGGQHRNKVETAVIITHRPTGISAEANERPSQAENQTEAIFRLRIKLALEVRANPLDPYVASALWRSRCPAGKIAVNSRHDDFPAVLAEGLDVVFARRFDLPQAASELGCTATQLIRLFSQEPRALVLVNKQREALGLRRLVAH